MGKLVKLLSLCALFLVHGCATVKQPEVRIIDDKLPQISKAVAIEEKSSKTGLKRKVAIARFSNETKYGQSFFLDKDNDRIGKQAVDILSSKLLETDKFILLERADLEKINKELSMENYSPLKNMADVEFQHKSPGSFKLIPQLESKELPS